MIMVIAFMVGAYGCGESTDPASASKSSSSLGVLDHVDGTLTENKGGFVLSPTDGSDSVAFVLGPEVEVGAIRALEAARIPARVSFQPDTSPLVAASVLPAPKLGEGMESVKGLVVSVDAEQLVIEGTQGKRKFDISASAEGAFDIAHLEEHSEQREAIKVYFDPKAPSVGIAYEDA